MEITFWAADLSRVPKINKTARNTAKEDSHKSLRRAHTKRYQVEKGWKRMNKIVKDIAMIAAAGTAGFCAYKWMSPTDKQKISRDVRRTVEDMGDVKQDVTRMASTIKDTF